MNFAAWLATLGLERHTAGLIATLGVACALTLLGVACVAWCEGWRPPRQRPSPLRGATRHKPGQP